MPNGKKDTVKRSRYPFCARETPPYRGADAYAETVIPLPFAAPIRIEGKDSAVDCPHRIIACVAVDRPIRLRLELQPCNGTALGTDCLVTGLFSLFRAVLARIAARSAGLGLVLEAFLRIEALLPSREHEFLAALLADQSLVLIHRLCRVHIHHFVFVHDSYLALIE